MRKQESYTSRVRLASATVKTDAYVDREHQKKLGKGLREESPKRFNVIQAETVQICAPPMLRCTIFYDLSMPLWSS